jgi:hypothetical protein
MLKKKMEVDNAVQFASQNKVKTEDPGFDPTALILAVVVGGGLLMMLSGGLQNGRINNVQQQQLIKELIKERR